jgi:predicted NAD/FAD-dependent oxidoreductase
MNTDCVIIIGGGIAGLSCALRMPQYLKETLRAPIGTFSDRLKLVRLSRRVSRGSLADPTVSAVRIKQGIYSCGEYLSAPSTQWAPFSGWQAAEALIVDLKK